MDIQTLSTLDEEVMELLKCGYTSDEIYRVTKSETREKTVFTVELNKLDQPFTKSWSNSYNKGGIDFYNRVISLGASILTRVDGSLAGVAIIEPRSWNKTMLIWEFHISPDFRRRGIGKAMMNHIDNQGRMLGFRIMTCEVQNTNVPALDFYRSAGFELEGIDLSLYSNDPGRNGEVAFFMKRQLH